MGPKVTCPSCHKTFGFKPELAGRRVKCKCGCALDLPAAPATQSPPVPIARTTPRPPPAYPPAPAPAPAVTAGFQPSYPPPKRRGIGLIIAGIVGACLLCLLCVGGGIVWMYRAKISGVGPASSSNQPVNLPAPQPAAVVELPQLPAAGSKLVASGGALICPVKNMRAVRIISAHPSTPGRMLVTVLTSEQRAQVQFPVNVDGNPIPNLRLQMMVGQVSSSALAVPPDGGYFAIINMNHEPVTIEYDLAPMGGP